MTTRSGMSVLHVDQRGSRALQPEGTRVETTASATGEGTHTRWIRPPGSQTQPPQEPASPSPAPREPHPAFSTPPTHVPTEPPNASPLRKQQRIGNPGIVSVWEDGGRLCIPESEPSAEGPDLFTYSAHRKEPATQRNEGRRPLRPTVGSTGTFIMPESQDERRAFEQPVHPTQITAGQPADQSPSPPDGVPLGPNGTYLVDLEKAWLGPNGTHLIP